MEVSKNKKQIVKVGELFERMPFTKMHLFVGIVLFIVSVIEAWEMMLIIFLSSSIAADFQLSPLEEGSLIGSIYLGMIPGTYIWAIIADRVGRRKTLMYSLISFSLISLLTPFSTSFLMLYTVRLLAGVALGGVMISGYPYFEEMLPVKQRGKGVVYLSAGWPLGMLLALGVTAFFLQGDGLLGGWRGIIVLSSLVGLWALMIRNIPESPYWLASKGKQAEAKEAIRYLSQGKLTIGEHEELWVEPMTKGNYFTIFTKRFRKLTAFQTIVNFAFAFGYWGLYTWIPTLLAQKGLSMSQSLTFLALSTLFQVPSYMVAAWLTGKYGRKKVMVAFVALAVVSGFGFAYAGDMTQLYICNFALAFFSLGAWGVWNTWFGEIYPTNGRVAGYSFGAGAQRWANTLAPSIIGMVIGWGWAFNTTVSFIQIFMVMTLCIILFLPETEGQILE
ncbi:MFS transporter [Brevibacillus brevis]|uniref:MFS transporter n=1 Tax=Brevibacillus brevis TaxID=1393 RepID=A0ABY9SXH2_BREBE|nr:MFS transporter [Brevibacillus brevis]WNC12431.1 MFS transporter [Brevibacillus brevis]